MSSVPYNLAAGEVPSREDEAALAALADHALVLQFLRREAGATEAFVQRLEVVPRVVACLNRRAGHPLTADELADLAQNAVVVVLHKLAQFPKGAPLDAWFYRIAAFELSNAIRAKRRRAMAPLPEEVPSADSAMVATIERQEQVFRALEQLPPQHAEAVRLHHLDGLTFVEMAQRLGESENTLKGRHYRGMRQMSTILQRRSRRDGAS